MKICLECGWGGHLHEMLTIWEAFRGHDVFFITSKDKSTEDLGELARVYYITHAYMKRLLSLKPMRLGFVLFVLIQLCQGTLASIRILLKERPKIIVTTAGPVTIPLCYIGKLLGVHIIYIESLARVYNPSRTGRLIYPVADLFLVQWEALLEKYGKKAKYWGRMI